MSNAIIYIQEIPGLLPNGFQDYKVLDYRPIKRVDGGLNLIKSVPLPTVSSNSKTIPRNIQAQKYNRYQGEIYTSESIDIELIECSNITSITLEDGRELDIFDFVILNAEKIANSTKFKIIYEFKELLIDSSSIINYLDSDTIKDLVDAGEIINFHKLSLKNPDAIDAEWVALFKQINIYTQIELLIVEDEEKVSEIISKGMRYILQTQKFKTYELKFWLEDKKDFFARSLAQKFLKYADIASLKEGKRNLNYIEIDIDNGTSIQNIITNLIIEVIERPELINLQEFSVKLQVAELVYTPFAESVANSRDRYHSITISNTDNIDTFWGISAKTFTFYTNIEPEFIVIDSEGEKFITDDGIEISTIERRFLALETYLIVPDNDNYASSGMPTAEFILFYGKSCFYIDGSANPQGCEIEIDVANFDGDNANHTALEIPTIEVIEDENLVNFKKIRFLAKIQEIEYSRTTA